MDIFAEVANIHTNHENYENLEILYLYRYRILYFHRFGNALSSQT